MGEDLDLSKNTDLNQALNEFQEKAVQKPAVQVGVASPDSELPKMVRLVMKLSGGAIKEQKQAEYILLGFVVLAILVSLFLVFSGGGGKKVEFSTKVQQDMQKAAEDLLRH